MLLCGCLLGCGLLAVCWSWGSIVGGCCCFGLVFGFATQSGCLVMVGQFWLFMFNDCLVLC